MRKLSAALGQNRRTVQARLTRSGHTATQSAPHGEHRVEMVRWVRRVARVCTHLHCRLPRGAKSPALCGRPVDRTTNWRSAYRAPWGGSTGARLTGVLGRGVRRSGDRHRHPGSSTASRCDAEHPRQLLPAEGEIEGRPRPGGRGRGVTGRGEIWIPTTGENWVPLDTAPVAVAFRWSRPARDIRLLTSYVRTSAEYGRSRSS